MSRTYYYKTVSGNIPVKEFLEKLSNSQLSKVLRILKAIENNSVQNSFPFTKKLSGTKLWEIRILGKDNIRLIHAIIYHKDILLLHGFFKKKQKTPIKDLNISLNRYRDWITRNGS